MIMVLLCMAITVLNVVIFRICGKTKIKLIMKDTHLCKCNNCGSILIDENPKHNAPLYDLKDFSHADNMISWREDGDILQVCPTCLTDAYLQDEL